jgi:hypothetical protein
MSTISPGRTGPPACLDRIFSTIVRPIAPVTAR